MRIVQLLPELNEGGVERGVVELNREYVKLKIESYVISAGGKLEDQINLDAGKHIKFDVCSKNIFTVFTRVAKLKKILKEIKTYNPSMHRKSSLKLAVISFEPLNYLLPQTNTV